MQKRILSVILSVMMILSVLPLSSIAAIEIGDVDGDNLISASDARLVLRTSVFLEELTKEQTAAADIDKDGKLTASDARSILRASVNLEELHVHKFTKREVIKEATCTEKGLVKLTCECGESKTEEIPVNPNNHKGETVTKNAKKATCCEEGYSGDIYCKACGNLIEKGQVIAKDSANHSGGTEKTEIKATCCSVGYKDAVICKGCGAILEYSEIIPIDIKNHTGGTEIKNTAPNCKYPGYKNATVCKGCGRIIKEGEPTAPIDPNKHVFKHIVVPPTCTTEGYEADQCLYCNYFKNKKTTAKPTGHAWGTPEIVQPTCTENGYTRKTCTVCGAIEDTDIVPATDHDYEWTIEKEATCTEEGIRHGVCKNCGYKTSEKIPVKIHKPVLDICEGTCTTDGHRCVRCEYCGKLLSKEIINTGRVHHWVVDEDKISENTHATCTEDGITHMICSDCGETTTEITEKALGHITDTPTEKKLPTCTTDGYIKYSGKCSRCGKIVDDQVITLKALGHKPVGEVTCTSGITCSRCHKVIEAPLGHDVKIEDSGLGKPINGLICRRCGNVVEDPITNFNNIVNLLKGSAYTKDHMVTTFGKTSMETKYTKFDFGIYTAAIKAIYDEEMAATPDEYTPVRKGQIWNWLPLHRKYGYVSLLTEDDIDSIKVKQLKGIDLNNVLSQFPTTFIANDKEQDITKFKDININDNVIEVTIDIKNETYKGVKNKPKEELTALQKIYDIDIREDASNYPDTDKDGNPVMSEIEEGPGYHIGMKMKLRDIYSDAKIIYYFTADTYEPIAAVYDIEQKYDHGVTMDFNIGLFSLKGIIDPFITTHYTTAYIFEKS